MACAHLGFLEARQEHYEEAIPLYRKALSLDSAIPGLRLNLGLAYFKTGDVKDALAEFRTVLKSTPQTSPDRQRLVILVGMCHYGLEQYAEAAPYLKEAVSRDPRNLELLLALAHSYLWSKQYQNVLDTYRAILLVDAESAEADMLAGEALDEMKDALGAIQQFRAAVQKLVESDGEIDLFEYVLQKVVLRHLEPYFLQARKPIIQYYSLKPLAGDCAVLLSALAYLGQDEPAKIEYAFQQGAQLLSYAAQVEHRLLPAAECELAQVDDALNRLCQAVPQIKKNVLNACAQTVAADGVIQETEAELLRAIADTLDCPMPPFIPAQAE